MGYVPKKKTYNLVFEDPELGGLEVRVRGVSTGQALDTEFGDEPVSQALELLAENIISWNVEDELGNPVPATLEGIHAQDLDFNIAIINAWRDVLMGVPAPLDDDSTSGESIPVASIPTETLSLPPESTAVPA